MVVSDNEDDYLRGDRRVYGFRKTHTAREIAQYVVDPEAPELTMGRNEVWEALKWAYVAVNVTATLCSCVSLIWLSFKWYRTYADTDFRHANFLNYAELACVIFFSLDYLARLALTDRRRVAFALQVPNIIDVLSTVPYFLSLILASAGVSTELLRVFFILRMVRIIRLSKYNPGMAIVFDTIKASAALLILLLVMVLLLMVLCAAGFWYAETRDFDSSAKQWMRTCPTPRTVLYNGSWILDGPECETEVAPYQSIIESLYWAIVMMTTTGYGAEAPVTTLGRIIAMIASIVGIFFVAAPATVLATNYKYARQREDSERNARRFDQRATQAMKAQEELRKELERVWRLKDNSGRIKIKDDRVLEPVATFRFAGVTRTIYEATLGSVYVYEPLVMLRRDKRGAVAFSDDFNLHTAQRIVACHLVLDCDEAREAARNALADAEVTDLNSQQANVFVGADPMATVQAHHDFGHVYPDLESVVRFDLLPDQQSNNSENSLVLRFVIGMPHVHAVQDVVRLLQQTRVHFSIGMRVALSTMHIPLHVDNLLASRLIRELFNIAYERKSDGDFIAYVHRSDAALMLEGFCGQFIPTPSSDLLIVAPELVDQQVIASLLSSFPQVRLDFIPPEGASSCYRSSYLTGSNMNKTKVLEINLTQLAKFDKLGYGHRFRVQVPICMEERKDVDLGLE